MRGMKCALVMAVLWGVPLAVWADWDQEDPAKWVQRPDLSPEGMDVNDTAPYILGNDFPCEQTGPITDIHIWGSWLNDRLPEFQGVPDPLAVGFQLSIWSDLPAEQSPTGYSMPLVQLWTRYFAPHDPKVVARIWADGLQEGWYAAPEQYFPIGDTICWQYNFFSYDIMHFVQHGTPTEPIVYWLVVQAMPQDREAFFGWKTSYQHWNDDAVWDQFMMPPHLWKELRSPIPPGESLDLAFVITTEMQGGRDWGDAPDSMVAPGYPTLAINNGANHPIVAGAPWLGDATDAPDPEADGQPDPNAFGDDNDLNGDDEDGVMIPILVQGRPATIVVAINSGGMGTGGNLDAWMDFNGDMTWQDPAERIYSGWLPDGFQNITFNVPMNAVVGKTFARFRISTNGGLAPGGPATDGEVEDHQVYIAELLRDWGDAPDSPAAPGYPTLAINNGANHGIGGPWLGDATDAPDSEADGQPDPNALGDDNDGNDDEDGVTFAALIRGQPSSVTFEVNDGGSGTGGVVEGYVDFDGSRSWDAGEMMVNGWYAAGVQTVGFNVPAAAVLGQTFARFRISLNGGLGPDGPAPDGEVEDHAVYIEEGGPEPYELEFSIDIGSDTELSDPQFDGDEVFDPGDVYKWWQGPPSPLPRNGFKNDLVIFGFDPAPTPGMNNPVPVGHGSPQQYPNFWDLDGHDQIDFEMQQYVDPSHPLPNPIHGLTSACVYELGHLAISFDDDKAFGWPNGDVPVAAFSPAGLIYGTSLRRDEVIGVTLAPGPLPGGYMIVNMYPIADEVTVHTDMQTNPDCSNQEDDDVDSLDVVPRGPQENPCPFWLFSPDHEANMGLDPGGIYQVQWMGGGGPPIQVIDEFIHLGLPESMDIDDFEVVFLPLQPGGPTALALVFSVDDDDPLTLGDESGGLNPAMLYGSYLTGASFPITNGPLGDDIDGIANWKEEIVPPVVPPTIQAIAWRSMRFHPGPPNAWLPIPLDPTAMGANATSESRQGGIQQVEVDFTEPIAVGAPGMLAAVNTASGAIFPVTGWGLVNGNQTLVMNWNLVPPGLPDIACYRMDLSGAGIVGTVSGGALGGDPCCLVRGLMGDTNNDGKTDLTDMAQVKSKAIAHAPVPPNQRFDVNMDGKVDLTDMALVKSLAVSGPRVAPCP